MSNSFKNLLDISFRRNYAIFTFFIFHNLINQGYNVDVLQQTACLVVNPIKVNSFAYLFNCTTVGRASD